ncbi:MAG: TadE/TadG family type IV pilus assembly protein [Pikeienuella sp.]
MSILRHYVRDDRGAVTVDFVVTFLPIMLFILTICEIAIAYYLISSAQKGAQLGARLAAVQTPIHNGVWLENRVNLANGEEGDSCYQASGNDACLDPGVTWECLGSSFDTNVCDWTAFTAIVTEVQRLYPTIQAGDVDISYIYRRLGVAGGPFVPEVRVTIAQRDSPVNFMSLAGLFRLRSASASVLAEDMLTN